MGQTASRVGGDGLQGLAAVEDALADVLHVSAQLHAAQLHVAQEGEVVQHHTVDNSTGQRLTTREHALTHTCYRARYHDTGQTTASKRIVIDVDYRCGQGDAVQLVAASKCGEANRLQPSRKVDGGQFLAEERRAGNFIAVVDGHSAVERLVVVVGDNRGLTQIQ